MKTAFRDFRFALKAAAKTARQARRIWREEMESLRSLAQVLEIASVEELKVRLDELETEVRRAGVATSGSFEVAMRPPERTPPEWAGVVVGPTTLINLEEQLATLEGEGNAGPNDGEDAPDQRGDSG